MSLFHACYMLHPSHPTSFNHHSNISRSIQVMKLLIIQSHPASRHFFPLGSKYSHHHSVLIHPQLSNNVQRKTTKKSSKYLDETRELKIVINFE
jgi:hypothetical protein